MQAGEAAPLAAAPGADNNDALAAPLAAPLEQESVPKAWPVPEVSQDLRDVDLEIQVADRKLALKRKHREMSDLDRSPEDQLKLDRQQFELRKEQEQWDIAIRKEQEQWDIARQTQLFELALKRKQAGLDSEP